jgi:hypothetical protein
VFFLGLDLGQAADFSALAILESETAGRAGLYHCRHLQRWPLRTPYPQIVADVAQLVTAPALNSVSVPVLAVDATGVGPPVVDLFRAALAQPVGLGIHFAGAEPEPITGAWLRPIQITGADSVSHDAGFTRVPKRDLISVAQVALQTERLKIAAALNEAATLTRELLNYQVKINLETAHDSYGAWRTGTHDDLVLALCLALWCGAQHNPGAAAADAYSYGYVEYGPGVTTLAY